MKNHTDFSSRIGVRAVTAGVMASLSFMFLALALIAALGLWNYNLNELNIASPVYWICATVAWSISLFIAGVIAALGAKSQNTIDGVLNAIAACCGSYLLFGLGFLIFAPSALDLLLNSAGPQFFLRGFLGDALGFSLGIYGGVVGANFEKYTMLSFKTDQKMTRYST